jgi:hypothetical protein
MTDAQLYSAALSFPPDLKKEIVEFVEYSRSNTKSQLKSQLKRRQLGCAKGLIQLSPNFGEPLEDFEGYM